MSVTEDIEEIVASDVRGFLARKDPARSKWLRSPEAVDRWYLALCKIKREVEEQFTARRARRRQITAEYMVAAAQRQTVEVTRVKLRINGKERELSADQAAILMSKANRWEKPNDIQELGRYTIELKPATALLTYLSEDEDWKASSVRFRSAIERDLGEAHYLKERHRQESLAQAIRHHRAQIDPEDATPADLELWKQLDALGVSLTNEV